MSIKPAFKHPFFLIILALLLSLVFSFISFRSNYKAELSGEELKKLSSHKEDSMYKKFLQENFLLINFTENSFTSGCLDYENRYKIPSQMDSEEKITITDRDKLLKLLRILAQNQGWYDKIICDFSFEKGYSFIPSSGTNIDSSLAACLRTLELDNKLLSANAGTPNQYKNRYFLRNEDHTAITNFDTINGGFFMYEKMLINSDTTIPYKMFTWINSIKIKNICEKSWLVPSSIYTVETKNEKFDIFKDKIFFSDFIPANIYKIIDYENLNSAAGAINTNVNKVDVDDLLENPAELEDMLAIQDGKKCVFIGSFNDVIYDSHTTYKGVSSGALLILSSYATLCNGGNAFNLKLYSELVLAFFAIFLFTIYTSRYQLISHLINPESTNSRISKIKLDRNSNTKITVLKIISSGVFHFLPFLFVYFLIEYSERIFQSKLRIYDLYMPLAFTLIALKEIFSNKESRINPETNRDKVNS